jgi:hypothetical protein
LHVRGGEGMREIKFRVFWTHPESDSQGFDFFNAGEEYGSPDPLCNISPFERFTGLRDINGKEIYEGDIVQNEQGFISAIEYSDEEARFGTRTFVFDVNSLTVIGNIHENPELLK